ncbi:MAG: ComEA family DNA-binding protein [Polyangiaceae bacterium]
MTVNPDRTAQMHVSTSETRVSLGFFRQIAANRWAKPVLRLLSIALALVVLAAIGSTARAVPQTVAPVVITSAEATSSIAPASTASSVPTATSSAPATSPPVVDHTKRATVDDPVTLNTATLDDLQRLPGIGPKRATAILQLRQKLGRFRQVEDLMRVKGVGRATLKKLRPIVRLD